MPKTTEQLKKLPKEQVIWEYHKLREISKRRKELSEVEAHLLNALIQREKASHKAIKTLCDEKQMTENDKRYLEFGKDVYPLRCPPTPTSGPNDKFCHSCYTYVPGKSWLRHVGKCESMANHLKIHGAVCNECGRVFNKIEDVGTHQALYCK